MKICIVNRWNPGMRPSLLKLMLEKRMVILYHWGLDGSETRHIPVQVVRAHAGPPMQTLRYWGEISEASA
jgi:hypothetical protein